MTQYLLVSTTFSTKWLAIVQNVRVARKTMVCTDKRATTRSTRSDQNITAEIIIIHHCISLKYFTPFPPNECQIDRSWFCICEADSEKTIDIIPRPIIKITCMHASTLTQRILEFILLRAKSLEMTFRNFRRFFRKRDWVRYTKNVNPVKKLVMASTAAKNNVGPINCGPLKLSLWLVMIEPNITAASRTPTSIYITIQFYLLFKCNFSLAYI